MSSARGSSLRQVSKEPLQNTGDANSESGGVQDASKEPSSGPQRTKARRAIQACSNCRKHKLRCLGGWPCNRCEKQKTSCDFDRPGPAAAAKETETIERLEQLEASVTTILASMSSGLSHRQHPTPHFERQQSIASDASVYLPSSQAVPSSSSLVHDTASSSTILQSGYHFDAIQQSFASSSAGPSLIPQSPARPYSPLHLAPQLPTPSELPTPTGAPTRDEFLSAPTQDLDPTPPIPTTTFTHQSPPAHIQNYASPTTHIQTYASPSSLNHASPTASSLASRPSRRADPAPSGESRLRAVTDPYSAPFKGVLHQPSVWNNCETSQRTSPEPEAMEGENEVERVGESGEASVGAGGTGGEVEAEKGDPVADGIVSREVAIELFESYAVHCHPFLPVVDLGQRDAYDVIRHKSPFLFSTILAIASRFTATATSTTSNPPNPNTDQEPSHLATLAESHLAQTLLRKKHSLSDVQATLLLAGWGLQAGGAGPDAWLLTGHAWRMGRRLGLWRVPHGGAGSVREGANEEKSTGYIQRWRTWLCLFAFDRCLSLGFGRPASQFESESVDGAGFIQECVARVSAAPLQVYATRPPATPSKPGGLSTYPNPAPNSTSLNQPISTSTSLPISMSTGDFFIASQVQLMLIGRDLCDWLEAFRDRGGETPSWNWGMFGEMNERLDAWSREWTWSSSPYLPYLNSSTRNARLYCEHVRLCLNSLALKAGSPSLEGTQEHEPAVGQCLEKALNAATAIIQTHHDAATTDGALSFCVDYLTIVLSTAAVFLIRLVRTPGQTHLDSGVAVHYLKMAVTALEKSERSQTRLSTHLAKTIREMARAAGFTDAFPPSESSPPREETHDIYALPSMDGLDQLPLDSTFEALLAFQNQVDPSYMGFLFGGEGGMDLSWA